MARLFNDPASFVDEMIEGFTAAAGRWIVPAPGGVVRAVEDGIPTVALITGGGSGHYPAFGGLVGPGLAHGAVMGNVFASPSTQQVQDVVSACDRGRGALMVYGNYAGDVLNFSAAQTQLREKGLDVRTVVVTDDIASGGADGRDTRRGIAGDLVVLKIAGAAAASGRHLDEVERLARLANERTVSLGVAFGGCTLPGAREPLFSVPAEKMALGLGIHGEPGLEELDIPTADELAHLLVTRLLADIPPAWAESGATVIPVLNGLGAIKVEELFVVFRTVARLLTEGGLTVVDPEVGELCTSFDMEGCSLTLFFPDDEMRALWSAPAESAGYRKSKTESSSVPGVPRATAAAAIVAPASEGHVGDDSRAAGEEIARMLEHAASAIDEAADDLGRLDAIAGDGDHGIGMRRGVVAAREAARVAAAEGRGAGGVLHRAADAWADKAGGTSGVLWGQMLHAAASEIGDSAAVSGDTAARAVTAAGDVLRAFGGAEVGDKTMVDAVVPFVEEFAARVAQGEDPVDAWRIAADRATEAAAATAEMSARRGRARTHGDRSLGTPDPGATSFALICTTIGREASVKEDAR